MWEVALPDGERLVLHVELQTAPDPLLGERLAEYAIRLWRRHRVPVRSVVVYMRETTRVAAPPFVVGRGGGEEGLRYRFDVVRLWEVPAERALVTEEAGVWPLAALMAGEPAATVAAVAERLAGSPLPRAERSELTGLLAVLAGMRLPRPVVEELLRRNPMLRDLLKESSMVELWLEQGREQGREQGQRAIAQAVLESRFGALESAEIAALQAADEALLHALAAHLATDSRDQIREHLGLTNP